MKKVISFHSHRGGVGKTTFAANVSAILAKEGYNVCMVDADFCAPSLHDYFGEYVQKKIRNTLNDYIHGSCKVADLLVDITPIPQLSERGSLQGKITGCFSSAKREDLLIIEGFRNSKNRFHLLKRFIKLRDQIEKMDFDYIIIDSTSGNKFWAINALAISDIVFQILKIGDIDIGNTKMIPNEILERHTEPKSSKFFRILNKVSGYCVPNILISENQDRNSKTNRATVTPAADELVRKLGFGADGDVITSIPCYCDIQFAQREFLTVLEYPEHPFTHKIDEVKQMIYI